MILLRPFQSPVTEASLTEAVRSALGRRLKNYPWSFEASVEGSVRPLTPDTCVLSAFLVDRASGSVIAAVRSRDRFGDARRIAEAFASSAEAAFKRFSQDGAAGMRPT
ncbi:hypothetical protein [Alsobacter sp. SYSU BS001988]